MGNVLLASALVAGPLTQEPTENFFDYVCRIKQSEIDSEERQACLDFVQDRAGVTTPYLETLRQLFEDQLKLKLSGAVVSVDFLDAKVRRLMKIFLKDKLELHRINPSEYTLAERAKWDPHFHCSSLFAEHFPKAKLYLPNFEEAYAYLKLEHRQLADRAPFIQQAMEGKSFAKVTEACSGYDFWHFDHAEKRIVPILGHPRTSGAVSRLDVTGYDLCGVEAEDHYESQRAFLESVGSDKVVRLHMGETMIPAIGRAHIHQMLEEVELCYTSSKPLRIGHGTHISIEDMIRVAAKGYYIEACLSSNKRTAVLDKRSDYPLGVMLLMGINVVIGTDGGQLYSTSLPEEYAHAARNLQKFHAKLQSSDETVVLPNGDSLCYKHILPLMKEEMKKEGEEKSEASITYRQLGSALVPDALERVSVETLVQNASTLLEACYSG